MFPLAHYLLEMCTSVDPFGHLWRAVMAVAPKMAMMCGLQSPKLARIPRLARAHGEKKAIAVAVSIAGNARHIFAADSLARVTATKIRSSHHETKHQGNDCPEVLGIEYGAALEDLARTYHLHLKSNGPCQCC